MLNNSLNYLNLLKRNLIKKTVDKTDLITLGVKNKNVNNDYSAAVISGEDFIGSILDKVETLIDQDKLVRITYGQLQNLISTNSLIPGQDYLISKVHPSLYEGTDIIIKAATSNKLELQGSGIFYNPKYNESLVYTNRVTRTEEYQSPLSPFDSSFNNLAAYGTVNSLGLRSDGGIMVGVGNALLRLEVNGNVLAGANFNSNSRINSIAVQSDNKVIIGGTFTNIGGSTRNRIARFNVSGSTITVDNTYSIGTGFNNPVNSVLIQPDGKVLIGGTFTTYKGVACKNIIRTSASGTSDATFTPPVTPSTVNAMALQSDGKILLGLDGAPGIMRLNANGTTDGTFIVMSTGFNGPVYSIALQSDGKIIVGGNFSNYDGTPCNKIARLNTDGTFDNTFNIGSGFGTNEIVKSIDVQADDKILVAGFIFTYNSNSIYGATRLGSDGTFDDTFANLKYFNPGNDQYEVIIAQPDNKVLVGGAIGLGDYYNLNLIRLKETAISYTGPVVQSSTNGAGLGWTANLNIISSKVTAIDTIEYGYGYQTDDTITILGSQIGGLDGIDDITLNVIEGITYEPGDTTSWGGYVWKNLTGNLGTPVDEYNLNSEWEKISYNSTDYNISIDTIEYHSADNIIWSRKDKWGNYVEVGIDAFQWGGNVLDNFVDANSLFECINARNTGLAGNRLITSGIYNNIFDNSEFNYNELNNAQAIDNDLENGSVVYNHLNFGVINGNTLLNSSIANNILQADSGIQNNNMVDSEIRCNIINSSSINNSILHEESNIVFNNLNTGNLSGIEMQSSSIEGNALNQSSLSDLIMNYGVTAGCNFKGSRIYFDNTLLTNINGGLQVCDFNCLIDIILDLSTATIITEPFTKTVFMNADGVPRLSYYDGSDTLIITDVNA